MASMSDAPSFEKRLEATATGGSVVLRALHTNLASTETLHPAPQGYQLADGVGGGGFPSA